MKFTQRRASGTTNKAKLKGDGQAFTLIELLIVVAIISLIAAILFPVFARARENGRRAACMSNLKQIGLASLQYAQDYDERLAPTIICGPETLATGQPSTKDDCAAPSPNNYTHLWHHLLHPYTRNVQIFNCPSTRRRYSGTYDAKLSYGYNGFVPAHFGWSLAAVPQVAITPLVVDSTYYLADPDTECSGISILDGMNCTGDDNTDPPAARHLETFAACFVDGHVKALKLDQWTTTNTTASASDPVWVKWRPSLQN